MNTYKTKERMNPIQEEIAKNVGTYNITAIIEEDKATLATLKNVPGLIAFICTLKVNDIVVSVGRGSANLTRVNKFVERGVRYSFGNSLVDAVVRGIKNMDALYFKTINHSVNKNQNDVISEDVDKPAFFGDEDLPQEATIKQINFLKKLVENCDEKNKEEYLSALTSPYLSKFTCSELIQKLMPVK